MERAVYTEQIANDIVLANMTVYRTYRDGVHNGYNVYANEGYVMYDPNTDVFESLDPETDETIMFTNYFRMVGFPLRINFDTFPYVAVLESELEGHYEILGDTEPDHEVM